MDGQSFGQAIGALILQKRRKAGLTQTQLAEDAYGTAGKTRRISELETGQVARPHPRTLDPLLVALGISDAEVEECARAAAYQPDPDLDRAYREARNLIEAAARLFDHARPDASLAELEDHIRAKAIEWRHLKERIEAIDSIDRDLSRLSAAASAALAEGDFEKVDALLAEAEEQQQRERTLVEVERQAEIRITRGDACLFREDPSAALECYLTAARYFEPFDAERTAHELDRLAKRVYEISLRALTPRFFIGCGLLAALADLPLIASDPISLGLVNYRRGLTYRNEAMTRSETDRDLLFAAVTYARLAVEAPTPPGRTDMAISAIISLANCLHEMARIDDDLARLDEAAALLTEARTTAREEAPAILACATNNLGSTFVTRRKLAQDENVAELLEQAYSTFRDAVTEAEAIGDVENWGAARLNCARILQDQANRDEDETHRRFLRIRAITDYQAAIETYPVTLFPTRYAEAQFELGITLSAYGLDDSVVSPDLHLSRAVGCFGYAIQIFGRETYPARWADIHVRVGVVFTHRANSSDQSVSKCHYLEQGRICFASAGEVYASLGEVERATDCEQAAAQCEQERNEIDAEETVSAPD